MLICLFHIFNLNQLNVIQRHKAKLIKLNLIIVKKIQLKYIFALRATFQLKKCPRGPQVYPLWAAVCRPMFYTTIQLYKVLSSFQKWSVHLHDFGLLHKNNSYFKTICNIAVAKASKVLYSVLSFKVVRRFSKKIYLSQTVVLNTLQVKLKK